MVEHLHSALHDRRYKIILGFHQHHMHRDRMDTPHFPCTEERRIEVYKQ